jgi:cyclin-dependent kinase regulatory subunit CKS1
MLKVIPSEYHDKAKGTLKLLWEEEWRAMGITQSLGWEHYEVHEPEPHILLFKYVPNPILASSCDMSKANGPPGGRSTTNLPPNERLTNDDELLALYHI